MGHQLKQLCSRCQSITFEEPEDLYRSETECRHYDSLQALKQSASEGCHLCILLESAWMHNWTSLLFKTPDAVSLNLRKERDGSLKLVVRCQERESKLLICDTYPKNCRGKSLETSFYARLDKEGNVMTPLYVTMAKIPTTGRRTNASSKGEKSFQGYPFLKSNDYRIYEVRGDRGSHYFMS
jgi:hypothetical protein